MKPTLTKMTLAAIIASSLLVVVQACTESQGKTTTIPKSSEPIPVKVLPLERSTASTSVITSGKLTTDDETILGFKTGGVVSAVFVKEGDRIRKGQILATLDLTEMNALVSQAKTGYEKAERDLARSKNLYTDSVATLEQLQNAQTAFELAKQQYNTANFNRVYSQIKAVSDGYVLKKFVNPGQVVGIGDPIVQTNGAGTANWIVKSGVSDRQWSSIKLRDKALVKVDAFPGKTFDGVVVRKSETADPLTGSFTVEILIDGAAKFANGMFASAEVLSGDKVESWKVPYEAVLDANGDEGFVFVTNDNKTAVKKAIKIQSFDGNTIHIASGIEGASSLIVSGSAYLTDRSPISIVR
jgi:RND family efflux transporter MFP subunit